MMKLLCYSAKTKIDIGIFENICDKIQDFLMNKEKKVKLIIHIQLYIRQYKEKPRIIDEQKMLIKNFY